ncbi:hypothetical protein N9W66_08635 [Luminiphilus sp.]|nr:hypothetical protein [Luminiphilus sp.]
MTTENALCFGRTGVSMVEFGGICVWLIIVLDIITGNIDKHSGLMFPRNAIDSLPDTSSSYDRYRSHMQQRREFGGEFSMTSAFPVRYRCLQTGRVPLKTNCSCVVMPW